MSVVRTATRIFVHALPGGEDLHSRVELPLVEAVTNGICHGNDEDENTSIEVFFEWNFPQLEIAVCDHGVEFDLPATAHKDTPAAEKVDGRGLFLMRTMSDRISVERKNGGNRVVLSWHTDS